jgi:hypothetical protein
VHIDTLGDAAIWLSDLEDRETVATHLYKFAERIKMNGRITSKLESSGKNVMGIIVSLYDQLELKLEGTKTGKYTEEELLSTRDASQRAIMGHLEDLHNQIETAIYSIDGVYDLSKLLRNLLTKEVAIAENKQTEMVLANSGWPAKLRAAIRWDALSSIQRDTVRRDLDILDLSLNAVDATKRELNDVTIHLDNFFEAVRYAKKKNTGAVYMGLDVEDLLKSYHDDLEEARNKIAGWD